MQIYFTPATIVQKKGPAGLSQALTTKTDGKLDGLKLKVETLNKQIEKSNEFINSITAELSELKLKPLLCGQFQWGKCSTQVQITME